MIITNNLSKKYGEQTALDSLNLNVQPGEIFCLLGANGAGKTTTINLLLGFIPPTSGSAFINQLDVHENPKATRNNKDFRPQLHNCTGRVGRWNRVHHSPAPAPYSTIRLRFSKPPRRLHSID